MTRNTPELDKLFETQETTEKCPKCERIRVAGETCSLCSGAGMVPVSRANAWRLAERVAKHGPLPPMNPPPRKT